MRVVKFLSMFSLLALASCSHKAAKTEADAPARDASMPAAKPGACSEYNDRAAPKDHAGFDANGDGNLSQHEYLCQVVKRFSALDKDDSSFIEKSESKELAKADGNKDRKVSIIEFMKAAEAAFAKADADDNGLSVGEYKRAGKKLP
jgi:hypothetical protein